MLHHLSSYYHFHFIHLHYPILGKITHPLSAKDFAFLKIQEERKKQEKIALAILDKKMRRKNRKRKKAKSVDPEQAEYTVEIKRFLEVIIFVDFFYFVQ